MYMRVVRNSLKPGQIDEFARRWNTYFPSRYTVMSGFRQAYLGHDLAGNAILAVTVWDARPDEAEIAGHVAEFRPQVADISSGPPSFEEYDLVSTL
jgi:heme-degrading monooxygenase HmoA